MLQINCVKHIRTHRHTHTVMFGSTYWRVIEKIILTRHRTIFMTHEPSPNKPIRPVHSIHCLNIKQHIDLSFIEMRHQNTLHLIRKTNLGVQWFQPMILSWYWRCRFIGSEWCLKPSLIHDTFSAPLGETHTLENFECIIYSSQAK